jgi:hypothetical protein
MVLLALALLVQDGPVKVAGEANQPHLAADKDGVFYCVFIKGGNIQLSTSADNGKTWSEPVVAIDAMGKARGGMQRGPRVGVDDRKRIYVTAPLSFDPAEESKKYPTAELWIAVSEDGKTFGKPVQVNEVPKKAPESLHWLAVSPDGAAHVVWLDMRDQKRGQDLFYAKWSDGKLGKNVKIGGTICECCAPGIGVDAKGNPTVAFREGGSKQNRSIFVTRSTDGGKTWKAPAQINQGETKVAT